MSSAWWWRRLDHAVLFKSFISVTHCPSQRNWWILQIYGIPMPEQVGIFFRGFARLMRVSHCSSGSSLVRDRDDVTHRSCANFKCEVSHVNKQLPVDFMGVKCVSVECDQPRPWIHFKTYLFRLICTQGLETRKMKSFCICIYKGYQQHSVPVTTRTRILLSNFLFGQCQSTILCYMQSKQYFHINDTLNMYLPQTYMTEFCAVCPKIQQK